MTIYDITMQVCNEHMNTMISFRRMNVSGITTARKDGYLTVWEEHNLQVVDSYWKDGKFYICY